MLKPLLLMLVLATPAAAQTLRIGTQSPFVIDPQLVFLGPDMAVARMSYDSFVGRDAESRWAPALAVAWARTDDNSWVFKLRPGVVFSDGSPFTAADVIYSLDRIMALDSANSHRTNLRTINGYQALDPLTVRITTDRPNAALPGQLTNIFIVSAKAFRGAAPGDILSGRVSVGTGPFRVTAFTRGESLELERNDSYWGEKPAWAHVSEKVITNYAARVAALLSGDLDVADVITPSYVNRLEHSPGIALFRHDSDRVMFLHPNVRIDRSPMLTDAAGAPLPGNPLRDVRVRQAISLAIDRRALAERAFEGDAVPTGQLVPAGFGGFDPALPAPPHDPVRARALLAEAGYPQGFGMTIACPNNRFIADEKVCQILGQMLERAGFHMKVETMPGTMFFSRLKPETNEYPLAFAGQSNSTSRDPTHTISLALHSADENGFGTSNRGGFKDAELDRMIDAAVQRLDDQREDALHAAMMKGVALGALIPLYVQKVVVATRGGIIYQPRMDEQTVAQNARPR
jgi:peptide/nickel transport system substrate-binding protein